MSVLGTVYLLHFDPPVGHARHYIGWTKDMEARLRAHHSGRGGRLPAVAAARGHTITVARTWNGDRAMERKLKRRHETPRMCPICVEADATNGRGVVG